jgi:hypothetical protein
VDKKIVFFHSLCPIEPCANMSDKAPVEGAPTPLTVFEPVEGVFLGFVEGVRNLSTEV